MTLIKGLVIVIVAYCVYGGIDIGPITIKENGESVTRYAVGGSTNIKIENGNTVVLPHNSGLQIAKEAANSYSPNIFVDYKLRNKTFSFTADISTVGCSCNAALYLVTMPGYSSDNQPNPGKDGDYYCDANDVNGEWCWEMDIMEANRYSIQITPHTCQSPPGAYITDCDRGGCGTNGYNVNPQGLGPNSTFKINTQQPFRQSVTFTGSSIQVKFDQNGNSWQFQDCGNSEYIQKMNQALDYGFVLVMSHWGNTYSTMQWLDGKSGCSGDCDGSGFAKFGDIEIS